MNYKQGKQIEKIIINLESLISNDNYDKEDNFDNLSKEKVIEYIENVIINLKDMVSDDDQLIKSWGELELGLFKRR